MDNKYLIIVNKNSPMKNENIYEIVRCNSKYADNRKLEKETYLSFLKLKEYIRYYGYDIDIESGYRNIDYQKKIWNKSIIEKGITYTEKYIAKPGFSEHNTGLALDFCLFEDNKWVIEHDLKQHDVTKLIHENAYKFGFILRYPKDKEIITGYNYEPWHLRYINDVNIAKFIYENGICLEEYMKK